MRIELGKWRGRAPVALLLTGAAAGLLACVLVLLGAFGLLTGLAFGRALGGMGGWGTLIVLLAALALVLSVVARRHVFARIAASCALAAVGVALVALFPPRWLLALGHNPAGPVFCFETGAPIAALTIDDGLSPQGTPAILDVLQHHDARATFFVMGETLDANPGLVQRILDEGHELANHQMSAAHAIRLSDDRMAAEFSQADRELRALAPVRWFRPAGGYASDGTIRLAREHECAVALGSVFPFDSHIPWTRFIAAYVAHRTTPGDIIVLHDGPERGQRTAEALKVALPRLAQRGVRCVTLSQLADTSHD